ncbi:MAG: serine hydrolase domain-containing protein, partial [Longimicrobiales bacterium]|nr:serine hydrolase domain-containing protein [Longimicrobiales bacterium]
MRNIRSAGRPVLLSLALMAGITAAPAQAAAQSMDLERLNVVADSVAHDHLARNVTPGVTIAVARDGEIVFQEGYGLADVENGVAARPETVYRIGSITKQFTAAGIMQLVEDGSLSLDDPITDYLPGYDTQGHPVTVRHLLNHTSGIKSYTGMGPTFWEQARLDLSDQELVEVFSHEPFDFEPGENYLYNNSAYFLLGMILGEVTGTPYARWVEESVFEPLGMKSSRYCD